MVVDWEASARAVKASATATRKKWKHSLSLRTLQRALQRVISESGKPCRPYGVDGPEVIAVSKKELRDTFCDMKEVDSTDEESAEKAKERAFRRALQSAADDDLIGIEKGLVWIVA
jgi:hypothetical protein